MTPSISSSRYVDHPVDSRPRVYPRNGAFKRIAINIYLNLGDVTSFSLCLSLWTSSPPLSSCFSVSTWSWSSTKCETSPRSLWCWRSILALRLALSPTSKSNSVPAPNPWISAFPMTRKKPSSVARSRAGLQQSFKKQIRSPFLACGYSLPIYPFFWWWRLSYAIQSIW